MRRRQGETVSAIQALRAFAVLWVVVDHAFPGALPGGFVGVDVFFVISGCLITAHLLRQIEHGAFSFAGFYLRRARRLLPAALLVLTVSGVGTLILLPPAWRESTLSGIGAASVYGVNWWLAAHSVRYFAEGGAASPIKHFWSLSVEEQFYLVWPALLVLAARIGRRERVSAAASVAVTLAVIVGLSFAAAVIETERDRAAAYFLTHGRAWEFAIGGLAALAAPGLLGRLGPPLRAGLFFAGWFVLLLSGFVLGPEARVPGIDVVPVVLATAALLVLGDQHGVALAGRLIAWRPVQWLGDTSYSLYLWHWPLLGFAPFVLGRETLTAWQSGGVLLAALALSDLTWRQIENRFRSGAASGSARPSLVLGAYVATSATLALSAFGLSTFEAGQAERVAARLFALSQTPGPCFGGQAALPGADCPHSHRLADEGFAMQTWSTQRVPVPHGRLCQNEPGDSALAPCEWGAPAHLARRRLAMLGDSHVGMWAAAIIPFAEEEGLRIRAYQASSCAATDDTRSFATYLLPDRRAACLAWRQAAASAILADPSIDTVIVSANAYQQAQWTGAGWIEDDGSGFASLWKRFLAAGKQVVVIDDVPLLRTALPECLARPHADEDPCSRPVTEVPPTTPLARAVAQLPAGAVKFLRMRDLFCDETRCHAIIGGIPAYMDTDHISAPMARSLSVLLRAAVSLSP